MSTDEAEQKNVAADHRDVVDYLTKLLDRYISQGRSTPGAALTNDVELRVRKPVRPTTEQSS